MNVEIFAEWLRRQKHSVFKTTNSYWYDAGPWVYQAFPYHRVIQPSEEELLYLLSQKKALALRYSTTMDNPIGCISYHTVYDKITYTLDSVSRQSRQNIRKGLKNCIVMPVSFEQMAEDGWLLETSSAYRQGRKLTMSKEMWRRRYLSAKDLPGFECWGAFVDNRLVASILTFQMEDCCEMISQQSNQDYFKLFVNNALIFVVTQNIINRKGIRSVFYGLHSLDASMSVDKFKFRMGYMAKPVRQRVFINPRFRFIVNDISQKCIDVTLNLNQRNSFLSKAKGLFRLYLQGKYPLENQEWPKCLNGCKKEMVERYCSRL